MSYYEVHIFYFNKSNFSITLLGKLTSLVRPPLHTLVQPMSKVKICMASLTLFVVVISYALNKEVRDDAQVQKKQGRIYLQ